MTPRSKASDRKERRKRLRARDLKAIAASRRGVEQSVLNPDRWVYAQSLRDAGHSLDAIASELGVTRQRVQQKTRPTTQYARENPVDPIALMRAIRRPDITSYLRVAKTLDNGDRPVIATVEALGLRPAVDRLFRWRRTAPTRQRFARATLDLAARIGRSPTLGEMASTLRVPKNQVAPRIRSVFGTMAAFWAYVDLTPRQRGYRGQPNPKPRRENCLKCSGPLKTTPGGWRYCTPCESRRKHGSVSTTAGGAR